ncbi:MAG: TolC family protein [Bacteroidia bacterium]|nr:TolC family protein [Bacteroidia bacterium]
MKNLLWFLLILTAPARAQEPVQLETVLSQAALHYPLSRQRDLVNESRHFSLAALNRAYLPQLNINGQATYQSAVTELPIKIPLPGFEMESPDKDQYKVVADVSQVVYDGGAIYRQKGVQKTSARVEQEKINVEMQKMRERVRQLFLGVLMLDEQVQQITLVDADLQSGIKRMESAVKNGSAFRSQLAQLRAEELKNNQRRTELLNTRRTLLKTLSLFTGIEFADDTRFMKPAISHSFGNTFSLQRPELGLFMAQDSMVAAQGKLIGSKSLPKLSLFAQGGYGRPGLNMLDNDFAWFYLAGARLSWNLGALYSLHAERKVNRISRSSLQIQKELYLLNANITVEQYRNEMEKYQKLLLDDAGILSLREEIMNASRAQLQNGLITAADYLRDVHAADQARQAELLHRLQLLQVQLDYTDYISQP